MNSITDKIKTGTLGELLLQIRFLEHDVQAAPPLKDSGNDLIAVRGNVTRSIQVKTTTTGRFNKTNLPEHYDILAVVYLQGDEHTIYLDKSPIFLIPKNQVETAPTRVYKLNEYFMESQHVNTLF